MQSESGQEKMTLLWFTVSIDLSLLCNSGLMLSDVLPQKTVCDGLSPAPFNQAGWLTGIIAVDPRFVAFPTYSAVLDMKG